jgi:predicted PurR-regulated permease PerM
MELDDMELYYTRKQKGLISQKDTQQYIKYLERQRANLEEIEKIHQKENGKLRIQIKKLEKNVIKKTNNIVKYIIIFLVIVFLLMNIKIRNEEIWQQKIEIEDLKEQINILKLEEK